MRFKTKVTPIIKKISKFQYASCLIKSLKNRFITNNNIKLKIEAVKCNQLFFEIGSKLLNDLIYRYLTIGSDWNAGVNIINIRNATAPSPELTKKIRAGLLRAK